MALEGRNFRHQWGLHNGAIGYIDEMVFEKGSDPNNGSLPLFLVVDFPGYQGPPWDKNNPTVSPNMTSALSMCSTSANNPFFLACTHRTDCCCLQARLLQKNMGSSNFSIWTYDTQIPRTKCGTGR